MFKHLPLLWANLGRKKLRTGLDARFHHRRVPAVRPDADAARRAHRQSRSRGCRPPDDDAQDRHHPAAAGELPQSHPRGRRRQGGDFASTGSAAFTRTIATRCRRSPSTCRTFFQVYPEYALPPEQKEAWFKDRTGAIVGKMVAQQLRLESRRHDPDALEHLGAEGRRQRLADEGHRHLRRRQRRQPERVLPSRVPRRVPRRRRAARARSAGWSCASRIRRRPTPSPGRSTRSSPTPRPRPRPRPRKRSSRASPTRWATSARCSRRSPAQCSSRCCWSRRTRWGSRSASGSTRSA